MSVASSDPMTTATTRTYRPMLGDLPGPGRTAMAARLRGESKEQRR